MYETIYETTSMAVFWLIFIVPAFLVGQSILVYLGIKPEGNIIVLKAFSALGIWLILTYFVLFIYVYSLMDCMSISEDIVPDEAYQSSAFLMSIVLAVYAFIGIALGFWIAGRKSLKFK